MVSRRLAAGAVCLNQRATRAATMIKQFASTLFWRKAASDGAAMSLNQDIYTYFQDLFKVRRLVQPDDFTELIAEECKKCHRLLFQQWRDEAKTSAARDYIYSRLVFAQELRKRYGSKHFSMAVWQVTGSTLIPSRLGLGLGQLERSQRLMVVFLVTWCHRVADAVAAYRDMEQLMVAWSRAGWHPEELCG